MATDKEREPDDDVDGAPTEHGAGETNADGTGSAGSGEVGPESAGVDPDESDAADPLMVEPDVVEPDPDEERERIQRQLRVRTPWWAIGVVTVVVAAVSLLLGFVTANVTTTIGPHRAEVAVTVDSDITVDLGPAGTVVLDSPLPARIGVRAVVKELPSNAGLTDSTMAAGLLADADAYTRMIAYPDAVFAEPVRALTDNALARAAVIGSIALVGIGAVHSGLHGRWRRAFRLVTDRPVVVALTASAVVVGSLAAGLPALRNDAPPGHVIDSFDGTPIEGARVSGRLADLLTAYGPTIRLLYDGNNAFFTRATATLDDELAAAGISSNGPDADPPEDTVTALFFTDVHCNIGMAELVGHTAEAVGADMILDTGDTTIAGTALEEFCVNAVDRAMPADVPYVVAAGNHDSIVTVGQMRRAGWIVLDGSTVEVAGVRILGDTDPRLTTLDQPTVQERNESWEETALRLADEACVEGRDGSPVDLVMIHDAYAGRRVAWSGCAPLTLSGHIHQHVGPELDQHGIRWVEGAAGGQGTGVPTLGPIRADAPFGQIEFDAETGEALRYRRIFLRPEGSVVIGDWANLPATVPLPKVDGPAETASDGGAGQGEEESGPGDGNQDDPTGGEPQGESPTELVIPFPDLDG
jgi:hypothetical protein